MIRILLVYEDFNELTLTESYLKKVGFDVVGISNEVLINDQIVSFRPEIIVAFGKNMRVSSFSVGQKLKDNPRFNGKVVIIVPKEIRPAPHEMLKMKMDAILESPVKPEKLISVLSKLAGISPQTLAEKFKKSKISDPEIEKMIMVSGTLSDSKEPLIPAKKNAILIDDPSRAERYNKIAQSEKIDVKATSHGRTDVKEHQESLKKDWDFEELEEIDKLKREFADALFRKN